MRRTRQTKILATLGPATSSPEMIETLFMAGVDVFRLNFSHGEKADHKARFDAIRDLERKTGRPAAILLDLQGPKLRIGTFADGPITLDPGASFQFDLEDKPGDKTRVRLPHPEIFKALEAGTDLLLDDGRLRLQVETCDESHAACKVIIGGPLSERKGVNVPGVVLPLSPLTAKDREDLEYGLELGVDWVALSFVQRPEDMEEAHKLVGGQAGLMAKLEKPAAIDKLEEIVALSDAIMVARGDLGVEMPPEDVPVLQRNIIRTARLAGKPVVVATQMLDSMIDMPVPTRAEASDVATAVYDGADAVMLSAETAVGTYPVETVSMMSRIIERVQKDPYYKTMIDTTRHAPEATTADAISVAVRQIGDTIEACALVAYTTSGSTTLRIARERPNRPIISLTPREETARKMALVWGVHSVRAPDAHDLDDMVETAIHQVKIDGFGLEEDRIVITAGVPFGNPGKTNLLRIARL